VNTGHRIVYPFSDDEVKQQIQEEVGIKPEFAIEAANAGGGERETIQRAKETRKKLWLRGTP
jgi:hypothetical protein